MWKVYSSRVDMATNEVEVKLNMLGPIMKNWNGCNLYSTCVIGIEWSDHKEDTKFMKKSA